MPLGKCTGCIAIPCSRSRTGLFAAKIPSCLLVAGFTRSILLWLVASLILGPAVANLAPEVLRQLIELQHYTGEGVHAW